MKMTSSTPQPSKLLRLALVGTLLASVVVGCAPMTYRNEYVSSNNPKNSYPRVAMNTDGYFADQVGLELKKQMAGKVLMARGGDLTLNLSSRLEIYSRREGFFKFNARPAITTLTLQAVRNSDQEVVYSLVKQYAVIIDRKQGAVTDGWVNKAATELVTELSKNVLNP